MIGGNNMQIETLRRLIDDGRVMWTTHCLERMGERDILRADVKNCITHGEIMEDFTILKDKSIGHRHRCKEHSF